MSLLFPKKCLLCGCGLSELDSGRALLCPVCAVEVRAKYRCTQTVSVPGADGAASALLYTGAVRGAIKRLKFGGNQQIADWLAAQTAPLLTARLDDWQPDLITFAPIGLQRRHERGYNQAELIARPIAQACGLVCTDTLKKSLFIGRQSAQKTAEARRENAERAFCPRKNVALTGKAVVFVDDILTTGATAAAAVRVLREMGAARVYVLTAAYTPRQ